MRRISLPTLFFGAIFLSSASAQQQKPAPPTGNPSNGTSPAAQQNADSGTATPASAEEDIEVATYYIHKGDPDAAIPRLEEAIQQRPKLAKPRLMLAELYEKKGDAVTAIKYYKEYLQVFPTAPDAKKIEKRIEKLSQR